MNIADHQRNHEFCLAQASELLGIPVRALSFEWNAEQLLRKHLRLEARRGIASAHPYMTFTGGPKGQKLEYGIEKYTLTIDDQCIPLARIVAPQCGDWDPRYYDFWAVPVDRHRSVYRFLRRLERRSFEAAPPVMREVDRKRLWDNTVGFLRQGNHFLKKFGMPQKRGVVLLGEPGNGKTMASRWLLSQCHRHGLRWRSVSAEEYDAACEGCGIRELFELDAPGIVLFDDLDQALRDRDQHDAGTRRTTFLTELDGLYPREGVVYLFTSNTRWKDLDPAFRRPGRIDLFMQFPRPDANLRRQFVTERWHAELTAAIDIETVVTETGGLSFAEMDEVKKLLVLRYLETGRWEWDAAWMAFVECHGGGRPEPRIGFAALTARNRSAQHTSVANGV
jgi:cell division protease FtsH